MRCESWQSVVSARRAFRLHAGLAVGGLAAVLIAALVTVTRIELGLPSVDALLAACRQVVPLGSGLGSVLVLLLGSLGLMVLALATRSLTRQLRGQRRFLRGLDHSGEIEVAGQDVVLIESAQAQAFCAGFLRPRIYVSTATLARLSERELGAVVAHEAHHQRSRDPLRLLLVAIAADALFFLPGLRQLSQRYRELAEVAADEAASKIEGAPTLASALLSFGTSANAAPAVGIAPERVDHLLGRGARWQIPLSIVGGSLAIVGALLALALATPSLIGSGSLNLAALLAEACMVALVFVPLVFIAALINLSHRRPQLRLSTHR